MPELLEKALKTRLAALAVPTTTETAFLVSAAVKVPTQTCLVHVRVWAQLTTGAGTTAVTPRIRRSGAVTGDLVGVAIPETLKAAAGGTEPFVVEAIEERADMDMVQYVATLQQANATGDGSVLQAAIEVEILGG
jgi:hypothetical protein